MLSTYALSKFPDITVEDLFKAHTEFLSDNYGVVLKCSPEAYIAIKDVCLIYENEMNEYKAEYIKRRSFPYEEPNTWGTLFGVEIKLDPALKPGEWKFE